MIYESWRNAAAIGAIGLVVAAFGQVRIGRPIFPLLVAVAVGVAWGFKVLHPAWVVDSVLHDVPWLLAGALALWTVQGEGAWLRARSWPMVVLVAALFGDVLVAAGLALAEPDRARRARLVLAASGASLLGWTSGAATLLLGHGGVEVAALGLVLAAVGFARGGPHALERHRPEGRTLLRAAIVPAFAGLLAWVCDAGGVTEFCATFLERAPIEIPGRERLLTAVVGLVLGTVGDEGIMALVCREVLDRAWSLRGDWAADALRVGLSVGGGLPLLVVTRSDLKVGLPLWLVQVALGGAWAWSR